MRPRQIIKNPRQNRSQETVRAILEGAAYILESEGVEKLNTNRIATEAGVNIASIYQYFKNKEAIISALIHEIVEHDKTHVVSCFERAKRSPGQNLDRIIEEILDLFSYRPVLRKVLVSATPYLGDSRVLVEARSKYLNLFRPYVAKPRSPEVLLNALIGVCNAFSEMDPNFYQRPSIRREIIFLCSSYVKTN